MLAGSARGALRLGGWSTWRESWDDAKPLLNNVRKPGSQVAGTSQTAVSRSRQFSGHEINLILH